MIMSKDEDVLCLNYKENDCPERCTFWDCENFKPSTYFMYGIKELND